MTQQLIVRVQNVYGNEMIYPVNSAALLFAEIAGTKTLKRSTLQAAKKLGYEIAFAANSIEI